MSIPEHVVRLAVDDMFYGMYEACGIKRVGAERTVGGVNAWLSWWHHDADLDRWADDGGRA